MGIEPGLLDANCHSASTTPPIESASLISMLFLHSIRYDAKLQQSVFAQFSESFPAYFSFKRLVLEDFRKKEKILILHYNSWSSFSSKNGATLIIFIILIIHQFEWSTFVWKVIPFDLILLPSKALMVKHTLLQSVCTIYIKRAFSLQI